MKLGREGALVVATWLGAVVYALLQVHRYAVDVPFSDDFAYVEYITHDSPLSWAWLWAPHNEHRIILPKLVIVWLTRAAGTDFRAVPYLQVVLCGAASLACCWALARRAGGFRLQHALVPLVMCSWAYSEAFAWTGAFNLPLGAASLLGWWCAASEVTRSNSVRALVIAVICAVALALCGGTGVAAMAGVVPWFVFYALQQHGRPKVVAVSAAAALTIYSCIYAATYTRPQGHLGWPGIDVVARFAVRLLASGFCELIMLDDALGLMVAALLVFLTVRAIRDKAVDAPSFALVTAMLGVIGAIAIGRAAFGAPTIAPRYALSVAPMVVAVLALLDGPLAGRFREALLAAVATIIVVTIPAHDKVGHIVAKPRAERLREARERVLRGDDPAHVVDELDLFPSSIYASARFDMLRHAHGSLFRQ